MQQRLMQLRPAAAGWQLRAGWQLCKLRLLQQHTAVLLLHACRPLNTAPGASSSSTTAVPVRGAQPLFQLQRLLPLRLRPAEPPLGLRHGLSGGQQMVRAAQPVRPAPLRGLAAGTRLPQPVRVVQATLARACEQRAKQQRVHHRQHHRQHAIPPHALLLAHLECHDRDQQPGMVDHELKGGARRALPRSRSSSC